MWKKLLRLWRKIKLFLKGKEFKMLFDFGLQAWDKVDGKFSGPLKKTNFQYVTGEWKPGGEDAYRKEREDRRNMWRAIVKELVMSVAASKWPALTPLLDIVLGWIGLEKKAENK